MVPPELLYACTVILLPALSSFTEAVKYPSSSVTALNVPLPVFNTTVHLLPSGTYPYKYLSILVAWYNVTLFGAALDICLVLAWLTRPNLSTVKILNSVPAYWLGIVIV